MAIETRYFCTGSCGAVKTLQEYEKGEITCAEMSCDRYDKPFEKGLYCISCEKRIGEGEKDQHQH